MKKTLVLCFASVIACFVLMGCDTKPPTVEGLDKKHVEVMCGTDFNLDNYIADNVVITDETDDGVAEYQLNELEYAVSCDEYIYDSETGSVNTGEFGNYDVELTVKDKANNEAKIAFTLFLNPLEIQKGFYVYKNSFAENFELLGYCSIENRSNVPININEIEFQYFDGNGIRVAGTDTVVYAPKFLAESKINYGLDTYSGFVTPVTREDEVAEIRVNVDYTRAVVGDKDALDVGEVTRSGSGRFAPEAIVENPYDKKAEYVIFLVGMYDADDNLIAVTRNYSTDSIDPKSKAKLVAGWLPDSMAKPDATVRMRGTACSNRFTG